MKRTNSNIISRNGFTLIEIIATIVMMGILAAFFVHFMGTAMDDSWKSVDFVAGEADAEGIIEEIIAYYTSQINSDPDTALSNTSSEYGGVAVMKYIEFDAGGNELEDTTPPYYNLKVTVEGSSHNLTTILTKSRINASEPIVYY